MANHSGRSKPRHLLKEAGGAIQFQYAGRFRLTPLYDVLTAQPSLDARQIERRQMKLALSVGDSRHCRMDEVRGRHFVQTAEKAGLPGALARGVLTEVAGAAERAISTVEQQLPSGFPEEIHDAVAGAIKLRLNSIGDATA